MSAPTDHCTATKVRRLSRRVSQIYDEALAAHGLSIGQFGLLACLSRRRGLSIGALAAQTSADPSTISRLVKPLAQAGLLRIEAAAVDKRSRLVWLTEAGYARRAAAQPAWLAAQAAMAHRLGDSRLAALRFLLDEAHDRLEAQI
jgi:DNA-binding MarR family transcriptional regulator